MTQYFVLPHKSSDAAVSARYIAVSWFLAAVVIIFGVLTAAFTISLVVRSFTPALYWDQWQVVDSLVRAHGHPSLQTFWEQHNEHRIFVGRLFYFADLMLFGGTNVSLLIEIVLVQTLHLALFIFVLRRLGSFGKSAFATLAGLFIYCMFSPLQIENFVWGFQIVFVIAPFASSLAFVLFILRSEILGDNLKSRLLLSCALLSALVAEGSLANGLLLWPFLLILAIFLRFPRREQSIILLSATVGTTAYLIGYRSPGNLSNPLISIGHPLKILKYVITYLAYSWDPSLPNGSVWPTVSESLTFLAICFVVIEAFRSFRNPSSKGRLEIFILSNAMFALATATITALGRINLGYGQATGGRYQTYSLIFWGCLATLLAARLSQVSVAAFQVPAFQTVVLLLLLSVPGRFNAIEAQQFARQAGWEAGMKALEHHKYADPSLGLIYHHPQQLPDYYSFLRARHWTPQPSPDVVEVLPDSSSFSISGYQLTSASRCQGYLDSAVLLPGTNVFRLTGWAWDKEKMADPIRIAIASPAGRIVAFGVTGSPRPDVSKAIPSVASSKSGWTAIVHAPAGVYKAFAVVGDGKFACALQDKLTIRN